MGADSPGRWHSTQRLYKIGATSLVKVGLGAEVFAPAATTANNTVHAMAFMSATSRGFLTHDKTKSMAANTSQAKPGVNRQFVLAARPAGMPKESDLHLVESAISALHDGE